MAVLQKQASNINQIFDLPAVPLPPKGTYIATCLDVKDVFGVERRKFQSEQMEKVDITAFLFGFRTKQGTPFKIASRAMKISTNEKSALMAFLKSWLGQTPAMGWDYCDIRGKKALVTVDHEQRKGGDGFYAAIVSISPLPDSFEEAAVPVKPVPPAPVPVSVETIEEDELPF